MWKRFREWLNRPSVRPEIMVYANGTARSTEAYWLGEYMGVSTKEERLVPALVAEIYANKR
jgi:hypothetical protein